MENTNLPCVWPIFAIDYRDPLSGVDSHATDYEGNRQLALHVGSSPRSISATLFEGSHYVPSVGLAHACIIAATRLEGSHCVPSVGLAHTYIIAATRLEGSHCVPSVGLAHTYIIAATFFKVSHSVDRTVGERIREHMYFEIYP
jgi:hypothetical protein